MYVDHDSSGLLSILEVGSSDIYIITESLIRHASNPNASQEERERAKALALAINAEITNHSDVTSK